MERWQRRVESYLSRFAGPNNSGAMAALSADVFPVVSLGHDYADEERPSFWGMATVSPAAGFVASAYLSALTGDLLVESGWCSRGGGGATEVLLASTAARPFSGASQPQTSGDQTIRNTWGEFTFDGAFPFVGEVAALRAPANTICQMPVRGVVLAAGSALWIRSVLDGTRTDFGFSWRNLGQLW